MGRSGSTGLVFRGPGHLSALFDRKPVGRMVDLFVRTVSCQSSLKQALPVSLEGVRVKGSS